MILILGAILIAEAAKHTYKLIAWSTGYGPGPMKKENWTLFQPNSIQTGDCAQIMDSPRHVGIPFAKEELLRSFPNIGRVGGHARHGTKSDRTGRE